MQNNTYFESQSNDRSLVVGLKNDWVFSNVSSLGAALDQIDLRNTEHVSFQCGGLLDFDIAGAWVLLQKSRDIEASGHTTDFTGFKAAHFKFLTNISDIPENADIAPEAIPESASHNARRLFQSLGDAVITRIEDIGYIARAVLDGTRTSSGLLLSETIRQIYLAGVRAIPIVALISFLMGLVIAYQGALQLQKFGAAILVVDMVSISILREMGVLLAAIMVAGRSGSAFAASIGVMNLNEEIDALRVMGLNPNQVLVLPRILGLLIALPLLTVFADIAGVLGGLLLSATVLDISVAQFLERVLTAVDLSTFLVGISKAPVFALLIGLVATLRGLQVKSSAEQLGKLTTAAVVQSIFLIIVADGVFTVIFARYGI